MLRSILRSLARRSPAAEGVPVQAREAFGDAPGAAIGPELDRAQALYLESRWTDARELAERIEAAVGPTDATLTLRAHCLQYERRFEEAARLYARLEEALRQSLGERDRRRVDALIDQGLALLRSGASERARPVLEQAAAAAPDYPPAIGCARFPALMARDPGVPRRALAPRGADAPTAARPPGEVEIVYFFVGRSDEPRYAEYVDLLLASARVARHKQPGARIVLLTDLATPFPEAEGFAVERFDIDRKALMVARFEAIAGFLERKAARREPVAALFCDPDTLVMRDLAPLLDGSFEVAYTWRSRFVEARLDHEPFVAGATYVRSDDAAGPLRFFRRVLAEFDTIAGWPEVLDFYPRPIAAWRGDQIVPAAVIGWREFIDSVLTGRTDRIEVDGVVVALLPSDPYCFTFEPERPHAAASRYVVDFKGDRKAHLPGVAGTLLAAGKADAAAAADTESLREDIGRALAAGDAAAARAKGADWLAAAGHPEARVGVYRIVPVVSCGTSAREAAEVVAEIADDRVLASARLLAGAVQNASWAEPWDPPPVRILELAGAAAIAPNLLVTAEGGLLDDSNGFPPSELVRHAATRGTFLAAAGGAIAVAERWARCERLDEPVVYVAASSNYAEWLLGDAPRVALGCETGREHVVLHGDVRPFHLETLARLGVAGERLRVEDARTRLELRGGATFCTSTLRHHAPSPTALRRLRERFRADPGADSPRRVYLSRAGVAGSRRIRNESAIEAFLAQRGFAIVRPEALGVAGQARLVAGAEVIVGPFGANLANLVFAERASRVVAIATKHQPEFARLLAVFGVPIWHVVPEAIQVRQGPTYSESFELDLALLERALAD